MAHKDIVDFLKTDRSGLSNLGAKLQVPIHTKHLPDARLLWLNERWFYEAGVYLSDSQIRSEVEAYLLANFAVTTIDADNSENISRDRHAWCDRYGGSAGSKQGGSGRCAIHGGLNAKGIGPTPLVSSIAGRSYSHGHMSVSEAVREAILAELACAELPHGAIPVIAIIDTAQFFEFEEAVRSQRAAILVRPNFVRPAHFERSVYFGTAGTPNSDQYLDAKRVADAIQHVSSDDMFGLSTPEDLGLMFIRFAEQIGEARAHRLWQGRFLTSNLSTDGALVDFGSFRALPNWCGVTGLPGEKFGSDSVHIHVAVQSLYYYFHRYASEHFPTLDSPQLAARVERHVNRAFLKASVRAIGIDARSNRAEAVRAETLIWKYYRAQQRFSYLAESDAAKAHRWIYSALCGEQNDAETTVEEISAERELTHFLIGLGGAKLSAAKRWLMPRPELYHDTARERSDAIEAALTDVHAQNCASIANFIRSEVATARRRWECLGSDFQLCSQYVDSHSSALLCRRGTEPLLVLNGTVLGGSVTLFGRAIPIANVLPLVTWRKGVKITLEVGIGEDALSWPRGLRLGEAYIEIPEPDVIYS